MGIRLSEVGEYTQAVARRVPVREVSREATPMVAAREALTRGGNMCLTEMQDRERRSAGLGELVQVVT